MASLRYLILSIMVFATMPAAAEEPVGLVPSVQDNLRAMDKDNDGMVTVFEVRTFLESKHGKDYQTAVLDEMESSASGRSCGTPFAGIMY
jgi:methenyltetrahydromethanopterin cyclohydrolase